MNQHYISCEETVNIDHADLPSSLPLSNRHERHSADYRPADQHPGSHAGGSDHGFRLPFRRLRLHLRLEPVLHVCGVCAAVEGLPEDAGVGRESRTKGAAAAGAQTARPPERCVRVQIITNYHLCYQSTQLIN